MKEMQGIKKLCTEDGVTDQELSLEEAIINIAVQVTPGDGVKVKGAEEGIKMEVVLGKEDSEEMSNIITEDKVGLDQV